VANWGVADRFYSAILRTIVIGWIAPVSLLFCATAATDKPQPSRPSCEKQYSQGAARFEAGDYPGAVKLLEPLRNDARCADGALYMLEESYRRMRNATEAQKAFVELSSRYPDSALVHKLMGMAYDQQDDFASAIQEFEAAVKIDPKLTEVRFGIGLAYLKLHDPENAAKWMRAEVEMNSCHSMALYYLGKIAQTSGDLNEARERYAKAVACSPAYADAHLGLGSVLEAQGRDREALSEFQGAVRADPRSSTARYRLGRALSKAGQESAARAEFAKARELKDAADASDRTKLGNAPVHDLPR
jgi:tetratricopeptide (TPR) repeat protein